MSSKPSLGAGATVPRPANRFDRMEWAGAFGDLGTLIPFLAAYIGLLKMDPTGVLFAFGVAMLACGLYYRTPFPVQPMKAIGAVAVAQAAQTAVITPGSVVAAALVTGAVWLVLGLTGAARTLARLVPPTVVAGIVLGLGLGFMLEGVRMMQTAWGLATVAGAVTLLLMCTRTVPAMFVLLTLGAAVGLYQNPALGAALANANVQLTTPSFAWGSLSWNDLFIGVVFLALPQIPLTLGNAVIAIKEENNRLFPHAPVTEKTVAVSTGLMNVFSSAIGGVPMCHGAGGMAGHVAFGARTGGAVVILGAVLLALALFFSDSVHALFQLFPPAVLGVILFFTGAQLALGAGALDAARNDRLVTLVTAGLCLWNVAIGLAVGLVLHHLARRGLLRF